MSAKAFLKAPQELNLAFVAMVICVKGELHSARNTKMTARIALIR